MTSAVLAEVTENLTHADEWSESGKAPWYDLDPLRVMVPRNLNPRSLVMILVSDRRKRCLAPKRSKACLTCFDQQSCSRRCSLYRVSGTAVLELL